MKGVFTKAMVAIAAIVLVLSCNKESEQKVNLPEIEFSIEISDISATTAKIKVTHNQEASTTWYGFVTEDVTTEEQTLIDLTLAEHYDDANLHRSKQYVTIAEGLTPSTTYRYIAFGLSDEGVVYGNIESVLFATSSDGGGDDNQEVNGMRANDAWSVLYIGEEEINGQLYEHCVKVQSSDTNPYAITVVYAEYYDVEQMRDLAEAMHDDMLAYLEEFNKYNGTTYTFADMLYTGTAYDAFDLEPGTYRAIAVGYTAEGEISGLYAVSEPFEVKEPIASSAYNAWLGEWSIEGQNGAVCPITLYKGTANKSYYMSGWEGFDEDLAIEVEYNAELDSIFFFSQLVAEDYYLGEEYGTADIYFFAGDEDGYYYDNAEGDYYIAIGGILDDGVRAWVRYGVNVPDYPKFTQMFYMAQMDGKMYTFTAESDIPSFIAGMYPVTKTRAASVAEYGFKTLKRGYRLQEVK